MVCEAHAYVRKDDRDELFMENVDSVLPYEDGLVLENIFTVMEHFAVHGYEGTRVQDIVRAAGVSFAAPHRPQEHLVHFGRLRLRRLANVLREGRFGRALERVGRKRRRPGI